jgi:hypothetical protein
MGSGHRAHDLNAVPLPAAQGGIGHIGNEAEGIGPQLRFEGSGASPADGLATRCNAQVQPVGGCPDGHSRKKLQDLVHQNVKGRPSWPHGSFG